MLDSSPQTLLATVLTAERIGVETEVVVLRRYERLEMAVTPGEG